jgi:hypothetical protein
MSSELEALKRLLLREWDPLGLSDCDGAECHYDPYACRVLEMLAEGAEVDAIAIYLNSVVTTELSLASDIACDQAIATKAIVIHQSPEDQTRPRSKNGPSGLENPAA